MEEKYKLSELINTYPVFEKDQVLTFSQLNTITQYLDEHHRLTRVKLLGIGIVCGLNILYEREGLSITKGCAVTSDGDLLFYDDAIEFQFFKPFTDRDAHYACFWPPNRRQRPLFELLATEDPQAKPISAFKQDTGKDIEKDMAVLLYLESYEFDLDICTGSECDNKGKEQRNTLKALLVSKADLDKILETRPSIPQQAFTFENFAVERVLLNPEKINTDRNLSNAYKKVILRTINLLYKVLTKSYTECKPLLDTIYKETDPLQVWKQKFDALKQAIRARNIQGIQYVYDFFQDVAAAYNEFRDVILEDDAICCPDIKLFPKHVMLGSVVRDETELTDPYRHQFYPSPILANTPESLKKAQFLHKRLDCLIRSFQIPEPNQPVKITPSKSLEDHLGARAIPYYYNIEQEIPIHECWNYKLYTRKDTNTIYSYHAKSYDATPQAQNPLQYSLFVYPFFRIEGHLGREVEEVQKALQQEIADHNLPIKVITLQIERNTAGIPLKPGFWNWDLKFFHYWYRKDLYQNLKNVDAFNGKLNTIIQEAEELPPPKIHGTTVSMKPYAEEQTEKLGTQLKKVSNLLKKPFAEFKPLEFATDYKAAVDTAAGVNKNTKGILYTSAYTPYEMVLNDSRFKLLKWITEAVKQKEEKVKERSLFAKFLEKHPGMEHLAGVERGGTFILVYSYNERANTKQVFADFALPYWYYEVIEDQEPVEEVVEPTEDETFEWVGSNDVKIYPGAEYTVGKQIDELKVSIHDQIAGLETKTNDMTEKYNAHSKKFEELYGEMETQKTLVKTYSTSLDSYIQNSKSLSATIIPGGTAGVKFANPDLNETAKLLASTRTFVEMLDKKIDAGTASEDEKTMRKEADVMMGNVIKGSLNLIGSKETDIAKGSEEERFIEYVGVSAGSIKDKTVKVNLTKDVKTIKESFGTKTNFIGTLNIFKF